MARVVIPVILSGGSGTRLWPLSRELHPKQFLPLVASQTMFQETLLRLRGLGDGVPPPIVVCNQDHRFLVAEQLRTLNCPPRAIVLEPIGRNTAPAVAVAALLAMRLRAAGDDPLLLVLPADHVILEPEAFVAAVHAAIEAAAAGYLVTFGIVPDRPETGYGYLRSGEKSNDGPWATLEQFVEKPDRATAEQYVSSGRYLWNSGMFVFSAATYLEELGKHDPRILAACQRAVDSASTDEDFTRLGQPFVDCPSNSIDYAVMEKTHKAAVVPLDAGWSDVGSWPALYDVLDKDSAGNVLMGDVLAAGSRNTYVHASHRLVAAVGLDGHIIVETADAVLVVARDAAQDVKKVVDALKAAGRSEARAPSAEPTAIDEDAKRLARIDASRRAR